MSSKQTRMENLIERLLFQSNAIVEQIKSISETNADEQLLRKNSAKSWSVVEVVDHLNKVYDVYLENFNDALAHAPDLVGEINEESRHKRTILGRLSIFSMRPKGSKRKFKMSTFDFFEPSKADSDEIFQEFFKKKEQFNDLLKQARKKDLNGLKVPTALGKHVKFYLGECFEFILAHEQRHLIQIKEIMY